MKDHSIGIIGMGWVGASVAISILQRGICTELLLNDVKTEVAEGEALDLKHGASFFPSCHISAASIEDMKHCQLIIITAGRGGKVGESRLDLLNENIKIAQSISAQLKDYKGMLIIVSNPVDVLTYYYQKFTGLPKNRVIGTGTMLDTARLRESIGQRLSIDSKSIQAHVIGEHGDSQIVLWSTASIANKALREWKDWNTALEQQIAEEVRKAAQSIIKRKGATNHAIGLVTATLVKWLLRGERRVCSVSMVQSGAYGLTNVALSLPAVIGVNGVEEVLELKLSEEEQQALQHSGEVLRKAIESIEA